MTIGSLVSRITVTLALLTCLICPLVELFDNWDHTIQAGNDTECALLIVALCVGVAYSTARFIFKSAPMSLKTSALATMDFRILKYFPFGGVKRFT